MMNMMSRISALALAVAGFASTVDAATSKFSLEDPKYGDVYSVYQTDYWDLYKAPQTGTSMARDGWTNNNSGYFGSWRSDLVPGQMNLTARANGTDDQLIAFCLEYAQKIRFGHFQSVNYTLADLSVGLTQTQNDNLNSLWAGAYDLIGTSGKNAAAFQLAIWEIVEDTSGGPYSLNNGSFLTDRILGDNAFGGAVGVANAWLGMINNGTWTETDAGIARLTSGSSQDFLVFGPKDPSPVPLPAGFGLMVLGVGALGAAKLRRKTA